MNLKPYTIIATKGGELNAEDDSQRSSYRQIMKATSLFGGVQVFNILISIIRSKFVAILLGPAGMGIMGLLNSTLSLIVDITNFGLRKSAVKDISAANKTKNDRRISLIITVLRRLVWITGLLGSLSALILSSWLSQLTFGNKDYTFAFAWISITLLFRQLSSGQMVVLQGLRKLKHLAKANLLGSTLGLIITIPLYYIWGIDGIVPGIIITSFISLVLSWFYARKVTVEPLEITLNQTLTEGKNMLSMGFVISLGGLVSTMGAYLIRIFISHQGGVEQVGLYNAGFAIITMYMGLFLSGMATDYYPRLSSVAEDEGLFRQTINKQAEIGLLVIAPMLIIFVVFINWLIILLYSNQFITINRMMIWAALGMFFKVPGWSLGYVFLAKGKSALYFYLQLFSHSLLLGLNIVGYKLWGLTGLGVSITVTNPIFLLVIFKICNKKFKFVFDHSTIKIFITQFSLVVFAFLAVSYFERPYNYIIGVVVILLSGYYSVYELDKRLGLLVVLRGYFNNPKQRKMK